tara:strand:- start:1409 stop:1858 length:450 start_codon:yes stop_codon:yes gene_type:complete
MIKQFSMTLPGNPIAKGRPRLTKWGRAYTPKKTKEATEKTKAQITRALHFLRSASGLEFPLLGPIRVDINFYLHRPKNMYRKKDSPEAIPHIKRPDLDNLIKQINDCINGIIVGDDSQITTIAASKFFTEKEIEPRTEITVFYWCEDEE